MAEMNKACNTLPYGSMDKAFAPGLVRTPGANLPGVRLASINTGASVQFTGVAAIGAITYSAYNRYLKRQASIAQTMAEPYKPVIPKTPYASAFIPDGRDRTAFLQRGVALSKAMIAAVDVTDTGISRAPQQALVDELLSMNTDQQTTALLTEEINRPVDIDSIIASATTPQITAEIYCASLMAINIDNEITRSYLTMLAAKLDLPIMLTWEIEQEVRSHLAFDGFEAA